MDGKTAVRSVMAGNKTEYTPSGFWHHFSSEPMTVEESVLAHRRFLEATDVELFKIMNENLYQLSLPVEKASDWLGVKPRLLESGFYQDQLEIVRRVLDAVSDRDVYTLITIHGVFASAFHTFQHPDENFSRNNVVEAHILENPDAVAHGLMTIAESIATFAEACVAEGVDGVYYAALGGESYRGFSGDGFRDVIRPADVSFLSEMERKGIDSIVHICKDRVDFSQYEGYPGDVFNWAIHENDLSIEQGWELFKKPILGGLDDRAGVLVDGTEAQITAAVGELVDRTRDIPFILGADCTLPNDADYGRIRTAVAAAGRR